MSDKARTADEAIERIQQQDSTLTEIQLSVCNLNDARVTKLVDCLIAHSNAIVHLWLSCNDLTDETGVKLARYVAASSTIEWLFLNNNHFWLEDISSAGSGIQD